MPYNYWSGLTQLHNITVSNSGAVNGSSSKSRRKCCKAKQQLIARHAKVESHIIWPKYLPLDLYDDRQYVRLTYSMASHFKTWQVVY